MGRSASVVGVWQEFALLCCDQSEKKVTQEEDKFKTVTRIVHLHMFDIHNGTGMLQCTYIYVGIWVFFQLHAYLLCAGSKEPNSHISGNSTFCFSNGHIMGYMNKF